MLPRGWRCSRGAAAREGMGSCCSAGRGRAGDLVEAAGRDVVEVAVDRDPGRDERVRADPSDVVDDALRGVGDGEPVDVAAFLGAGSGADIPKPWRLCA